MNTPDHLAELDGYLAQGWQVEHVLDSKDENIMVLQITAPNGELWFKGAETNVRHARARAMNPIQTGRDKARALIAYYLSHPTTPPIHLSLWHDRAADFEWWTTRVGAQA